MIHEHAQPAGAGRREVGDDRGQIVDAVQELDDDPGLINAEPYGLGWMFRVRVTGGAPAPTDLLSPAEYEALTKSAG